MKTLPHTDVAIIGGGWTGLLIAKELGARTSLSVTVLERGAPRKKEDYVTGMDELDYNVRFSMMQDYSRETATLRYTRRDRAVPIWSPAADRHRRQRCCRAPTAARRSDRGSR